MRIGSRGSALALVQAHAVARLLGGAEVAVIQTSGDRGSGDSGSGNLAGDRGSGDGGSGDAAGDRGSGDNGCGNAANDRGSGNAAADKSRWVDAIERALLAGEIDLAVHSAKDLPGELPEGLVLLGTVARAPAQDALCGAGSLAELPAGARVGTSSLRRSSQLLAARPDLEVVPLSGNVDTRLARLNGQGEAARAGGRDQHVGADRVGGSRRADSRGGASELDAIVLARAGLIRLELEQRARAAALPVEQFVPSPGQGALALEGRDGDAAVAAAVAAVNDKDAFACLRAERALANALGATCRTPLGAHAHLSQRGPLMLRGWTGLPDGSAWIADEMVGHAGESPEESGLRLAERMRAVGAREMLAAAEALAA